ncbi:KRAB [Lepeophtheirus salmonis]|uniref:KRAB n=1 Tax=Lepeophtheirus salmonis TaxID=72036 RepID=A0A7R8H207_LEPSM|nr:KRAB [Lepeophtheirus salmonis]CAF2804746.1 KRAB [Lepeophtheirus salmonis]
MDTGSFEINNTEILSKDANNIPMTLPTQEEEKSFMHTDKKKSNVITVIDCFKTDKAKRSHLRNVHLKDKPFDCSVCGKFRASKDLTRHYRTHTGDKPYKCNDCDKRFGSPSNLSEHRNSSYGPSPL